METAETIVDAPDVVSRIFRKAILSRVVEERLLRLFSEGKLFGTLHTCIGQEMVGAVVTEFLKAGDTVFSNHRGHGHFLSFVDDADGLIAELMGRSYGVCGGMGGSQHLCRNGFYSNGIQGGIVPVAGGLAMAAKLAGQGALSAVFIGDGTLGEGSIYEAFNLASRWSLPLLVVLEDNGIAQSTHHEETFGGSISARAEGFGLTYHCGNTWDWRELRTISGNAVESVRTTHRPALLHVKTFRLKAHSKGDDTRERLHIEPYELRDPVNLFLADPAAADMIAEAQQRVDAAVARAEATNPVSYSPPPIAPPVQIEWRKTTAPADRLVRALNQCFTRLMGECDRLFMIGEDIESPYGGAFKVTQGLSQAYPGRVRNTPISEAGIVGLGSGLALGGWRPIVEIMFGDFLGLAFDQLVNHAAKFERMYAGQVKVDVVVRTPMGGRRGYGPTHSQTLDRHFLGVPGLRVLALNNLLPPDSLYDPLVRGHHGPTLVLENKLLYGTHLRGSLAPGFSVLVSNEPFPTAWIRPESDGAALTLMGYGGMSDMLATVAERLFDEHDLVAQVICPMQLYPFDIKPLLSIVQRAKRLLVVEEGQGFAGFGAEVAAQLVGLSPGFSGTVSRLAPPQDIIPSSGIMEKAMLPSADQIISKALELCR